MMDTLVDQFDAAEPEQEDLNPATLDIEIDITVDRKRFTVLHLEEPKMKQIERAERELNTPTPTAWHFRKYQMKLVEQVAKVPPELVGELTNRQLRAAWDFLRTKLERDAPEIGETLSET
jgi:hypothetical protein